jgi:hypothetical protein
MRHASPLQHEASEKPCSKCGLAKPLAEFYVRTDENSRGYSSQCKSCDRERSRQRRKDPAYIAYHRQYQPGWRRENREKSNGYTDAWRARNVVKLSLLKRKWRYGLAAEQFTAMLDHQDYRCAICYLPFDPEAGIDAIHVDHDHATDTVRGLLCGPCNRGLGHFYDDPMRLRTAADYIERWHLQMKTWSDPHGNVRRPAEPETTGPTA